MISIIYPAGDFEAADIAMKAQALAQSSGNKVYIVPKHFGRNPSDVNRNLDKTKVALFLAFEKHSIDDETLNELEYVKGKGVKVFSVVPETMNHAFFNGDGIEVVKFKQNGKLDAISKITDVIKLSTGVQQKKNNESDVAIILLILLFIVAILTASSSSSKKSN